MKSYCWKEGKTCVKWVRKYFKDCLCNMNDDLSFSFGILSLLSWGVAEIPQIFTNFQAKSSHGVSLLFLLGWVLGDIFNLVGCLLEPATLPTQFYTAFLYTASTIVLVLQSLYYDYFYKWLKCRHNIVHHEEELEDEKKPLNPKPTQGSMPIACAPVRAPTRRYYTSARSLAGSDTPPFRSYLIVGPRSGPSVLEHEDHSSSDEEETNPIPIPPKRGTTSLPRQIPRPAARGAIVAATVSLPLGGHALSEAFRGLSGRRMLSMQEHSPQHSAVGQWLGWMMAAIYMGGRIPQILWNIKRGSVEGLNPLMFVFALIANVAYVASILVRRPELEEIKANLPWLLDAIVCVVLDLFIIMQYVYYKHIRKRNAREEDHNNYYEEAQKPVVS
ncbi:probable vacuolar amino acid transporter YPQ3 isoform X1 [Amaranthus tricolor]|uniref:probable vacuolar amino acid transporter YPQ3 isoform X1 n=1 Tax=Amaranthus tricolor TaxID=29722 RepID=UPI002589C092|nr:probable vacuolar amino acid transporter YPQ3 isoform X1 [Amaranthus tricolor]